MLVALSWGNLEDCALGVANLNGKTRDLVGVVGVRRERSDGGESCRVACIVMVSMTNWYADFG